MNSINQIGLILIELKSTLNACWKAVPEFVKSKDPIIPNMSEFPDIAMAQNVVEGFDDLSFEDKLLGR